MIRVNDLTKTFVSGSRRVRVLSGISFLAETGQTLALAGRSGSGKTTLLHCTGGLDRPDTGSVFYGGTEVTALSPGALNRFRRRHLGFMFQAGNLISYLTVYENVAFPLNLNQYGRRDIALRVAELLAELEIADLACAMPHELSGGQTQRVAFARAVAHLPALLLADEPTASLDSATGLTLIRLMKRTGREHGITIIVATHDPDVIRQADQTLSLADGCLSIKM